MLDMAIFRTFTRQQIHLLASGYDHGALFQWDCHDIIRGVLGLAPGHDPLIVALEWHLTELMGHLVCVIDPDSPHAWILRMILALDFIWLGMHWAGSDSHNEFEFDVLYLEVTKCC
ncbi:hypothetical protein N7448_009167 [Penicillium atrosanguineum]|nr:hypothetical protein N7448_009167 [Penicillium atrosanguineum]KAJ5141700.1 hypothetical protein N7526_002695 [Penicillium atrosanguineum]